MALKFTDLIDPLKLVQALKEVLRITPTRIKILTSVYKLQQKKAAITSKDNRVLYTYDIVIAPDASNDVTSPLSIIASFANTNESLKTFQGYLPTFDYSETIKYFELMPVLPIIIQMPSTVSIKLYSATFKMKFKA